VSGAAASKRAIRARVRAALASMDGRAAGEELDAGLRALEASALWARSRVVLAYLATGDEPSVDGLLERAMARGTSVAAPRMNWEASTMSARRLRSLAEVEVRRHGVREPLGSCEVVPLGGVSMVLVPGVAFDRRGGRLGRGAGFYDRFLAGLPAGATTIGVCHAAQIVDEVPMEPHDIRVDGLVAGGGLMLLARDAGSEA